MLLDSETGKLITKNGRDIVDDDPNGDGFPWAPKTVKDLIVGLGDSLIDANQATYNINDVTKDKHLGLYFSASWCPPCKTFTPILIDLYTKFFSKIEIIFLSLDRDEASLTSYFQNMPWKSLKFADQQKHTSQIAQKFEIKGIPALVILNSDFNVLSTNARNILEKDANFELFPWSSNTVRNLETEL
ncbi:thioredoxin-like domain-containing protein, partial [Salmonella sp. s51228]|uniref:thioredoxin-like domain-containing protein n=1 Tax=Salmonella sp. s51228 TaxID=3159652 RepID=UPI00397F895D